MKLTIEESDTKGGKLTGIRCLCLNARSITAGNKIDEIKILVKERGLDVIGITESWLTSDIRNSEIAIDGFVIFRKDRCDPKKKRGGGVLLFVKEWIKPVECSKLNKLAGEGIWCSICRRAGGEVLLGVIYRCPGVDDLEARNMSMMMREASNKKLVVMGDFNYPGINWEELCADRLGQEFLDLTLEMALTQHVREKTRYDNVLDLVLTNEEGMIKGVEVGERLGNSDHSNIFFIICVEVEYKNDERNILNFNRGNYKGFREWIGKHDWPRTLGKCGEVNEMWKNFCDVINEGFKKFIPLVKRNKRRYPIWMDKKAIQMRDKKIKMWKRYKGSGTYNDWIEYKILCKKVVAEYDRTKKEFEGKLAEEVKFNPKAFYSYVRSKSCVKETVGPLRDETGILITDERKMCNELSQFFSSVYTNERLEDLGSIENSLEELSTKFRSREFGDLLITEEIVCKRLSKLKDNKAAGPDEMGTKLLKKIAPNISLVLAAIFTKSLLEGKVPDDWKIANVIPIFKSGERDKCSNYRPVSLTSQISKVMEGIIRDAIGDYMGRFDMIKDSQHGFVKGKSCLTNLLEFMEMVEEGVDNGERVDVVYLDFQKAFDKVPHKRLIMKIEALGVPSEIVQWIRDWLTNRRQRVVIKGEYSDWSVVKSGVPQGSVLGPLLFVIYVNDMDEGLSNKMLKFADDAKVVGKVSTQEGIDDMRRDLVKLNDWSHKWQMTFNIEKCKVMHIGSKNRGEIYSIEGRKLQEVMEEKDLGVIVTNDLKGTKQCKAAAAKANRVLGMIRRTFATRDKKILKKLYIGLVRPHLEYCVQSWRPHLVKDVKLLERVQRRATKMVEECRGMKYETRLERMGLTTLDDRRDRGDLIQVFKIVSGSNKVSCSKNFMWNKRGNRGHSKKLYKRGFKRDIGKYMFSNRCVDKWNQLPEFVVKSENLNEFKNNLDRLNGIVRG